jgi:hypothetical protein
LNSLLTDQLNNSNINRPSAKDNSSSQSGSLSYLENKFANRANICSNRKFPGETFVKDLEPTLKMIIIKELSAEKVDGKNVKENHSLNSVKKKENYFHNVKKKFKGTIGACLLNESK